MATLTDLDYGEIRRSLWRHGKADWGTLSSGPLKADLKAAFQAIETTMTNGFPTLKANTEAALGQSMTNALMIKMFEAWLDWRIARRS